MGPKTHSVRWSTIGIHIKILSITHKAVVAINVSETNMVADFVTQGATAATAAVCTHCPVDQITIQAYTDVIRALLLLLRIIVDHS